MSQEIFYVRDKDDLQVGTEEAGKESLRRKKSEEDRRQTAAEECEFVGTRKTSLDTRYLTAGSPRTWLPWYLWSPSKRWGRKR